MGWGGANKRSLAFAHRHDATLEMGSLALAHRHDATLEMGWGGVGLITFLGICAPA